MTEYSRYAIYHAPTPGPLAAKAARWLGRDIETGREAALARVEGLPVPIAELTAAPRKYGFHGTLRAPFRLAHGLTERMLRERLAALAARLPAVVLEGVEVAALGSFLALRPVGNAGPLGRLAEAVVRGSDGWRAPLSEAERQRRRPDRLTDSQLTLLDRWGYPFVLEEFRFHMTLTGPLGVAHLGPVAAALQAYFGRDIDGPYPIEDLCLFGERMNGAFRLLARYPLTG